MYKKRWIAEKLKKAIKVSNIAVLTGARQTGKTTLLRNEPLFSNYKYFTLDDLDTLAQSEKDPYLILNSADNIIIDEVQRAPKMLFAIKHISDKEKRKKFVLSGSANLLLLKNVSESLAGRATYNVLYPFSLSEEKERGVPEWITDIFFGKFPKEREIPDKKIDKSLLLRGFLPPVTMIEDSEEIYIWWNGYVKTYLERDLREISNIMSLSDFRSVMELLALRTGSLIDQTGISRDTGISQPTVHRYINLLEASHLFVKLRPFTKKASKRITKTPKGYFIDTGLASYLAGIRNSGEMNNKFAGHLFESMVFANLLSIAEIYGMQIYFWRTRGGREKEVDFVIKFGNKILPLEVKYGDRVNYKDIENLADFMKIYPDVVAGVVIYNGTEVYKLSSNIFAIPCSML